MNGPEHFRRGEALLESCQIDAHTDIDDQGRTVEFYPDSEWNPGEEEGEGTYSNTIGNALLAAQAHFMAAQVAATMDLVGATVNGVVREGWREALS